MGQISGAGFRQKAVENEYLSIWRTLSGAYCLRKMGDEEMSTAFFEKGWHDGFNAKAIGVGFDDGSG